MRNAGHSKIFAYDEESGGQVYRKGDQENSSKHISAEPIDTRNSGLPQTIGDAFDLGPEIIVFDEKMESSYTSDLHAYNDSSQHAYEHDIERVTFGVDVFPPIYVGEGVTGYEKMQHSIAYAPTFQISEMLRENESVVKFKRTSIAFDVYGAIAVFLFQCSVFMTRASIYKTYFLNIYFSCAFTFSYISVGTLVFLICIIVLERVTDPLQQKCRMNSKIAHNRRDCPASDESKSNDGEKELDQSANISMNDSVIGCKRHPIGGFYDVEDRREEKCSGKTERTFIDSPQYTELNSCLIKVINHWIFQEAFDGMAILTSVAIGVYLLARVKQGQCRAGVTIFESQECNPVASAGSIPHDQVFLCYITPVILQLLMKRTRFRTILIAWFIATTFVCTALIISGSVLQVYSAIYSLYFLYIHYETERFLRISHVQNLMLVEVLFKQQEKEIKYALEKVNNDFEVEKRNEKSRTSSEISHLKILMDNIAHNLITPIQSINMGIELLKSEYSSIIDAYRVVNKSGSELPFDFLIKTISASCVFMTMAINRSIDFSKINSNVSLVPTFETKELSDVLSEPINCIRTLQNTVSVKVMPLPANICPYIIVDEMWVKESLLCLLSNSVKYSNGGCIIINTEIVPHLNGEGIHRENNHSYRTTMGTIAEGDTKDDDITESISELSYIRVSVTDNGVGIPLDRRQNIFQPLRPSMKPTGGAESGTGLGLYSLFKRMEALKGSCGMTSRMDGQEGSIFWFSFPYRPDTVANDYNIEHRPSNNADQIVRTCSSLESSVDFTSHINKGLNSVQGTNWAMRRVRSRKMPPSHPFDLFPNKSLEDPVTEITTKVSPLRILIIEDSITIILIVTKLLENKGHIVESEKNGFSGLNRLKEVFNTTNDFDLVLLDVQMPVLDGFECVSRYRIFEMEQLKNLKTAKVTKRKTDTLKLLLHSKYFRISYANNLTNKSVNVDNFQYGKCTDVIERTSVAADDECHMDGSEPIFSNLPKRVDSLDIEAGTEPEVELDVDDENKDDGASVISNSNSYRSDIMLRRGNMAIVGMSANSDNESRIQALKNGMNFFITKPFSNTDLQNILNLFGP